MVLACAAHAEDAYEIMTGGRATQPPRGLDLR
jgi:hypothetical protein